MIEVTEKTKNQIVLDAMKTGPFTEPDCSFDVSELEKQPETGKQLTIDKLNVYIKQLENENKQLKSEIMGYVKSKNPENFEAITILKALDIPVNGYTIEKSKHLKLFSENLEKPIHAGIMKYLQRFGKLSEKQEKVVMNAAYPAEQKKHKIRY